MTDTKTYSAKHAGPRVKMHPMQPETGEIPILAEELDLLDGVLDEVIAHVIKNGKLKD